MNRLRNLTIAALTATLLQVALGGFVRASGSGYGCADDWPRCRGGWLPPLELEPVVEWTHRLMAVIVGFLVLAVAVTVIRRYRTRRALVVPAAIGGVAVLVAAGLGRQIVDNHLDPAIVTGHLVVVMVLVASFAALLANASRLADPPAEPPATSRVRTLAWLAATATAAQIVAGGFVRINGASLAFPDFPLMNGSLLPSLGSSEAATQFTHRLLAFAVAALVIGLAVAATRSRTSRTITALAHGAAALVVAQVLVGAAQVWTKLAMWPRAAHVLLAGLIWACLAGIIAVGRPLPAERAEARGRAVPAPVAGGAPLPEEAGPAPRTLAAVPAVSDTEAERRPGALAVLAAYIQLTKPRIIELLLVTTVPAMILAEGGMPSPLLILATLAGGTLAAGSANTFNCYVDRDIDQVMKRTRRRPLPAHRVAPRNALVFGAALSVASFALMWGTINLISAALALSATLFYVFVYTMWLKRSTVQNIVIGGAAGAVPVLVGWAAVTGRVDPAAWVMFAIVFVWTPPHFWALAIRYKRDYANAGVPMMPVVRGIAATAKQIVWYSVALVATSLALLPLSAAGAVYGVAAAALGALFVRFALRLRAEPSPAAAMGLFTYSITYLTALFGAIAADQLLPF